MIPSLRHDLIAFYRRHRGPVVVWLCVLVAVGYMLRERSVTVQAPGMVQAPNVVVSPVEIGQVASVEVGLLQEVRRGQVLVRMDDTRLQAEAAVVAAEVEALRRELQLAAGDRKLDQASDLRRFTSDVEQARLCCLEILTELQPDRITLADRERDVVGYSELLAGELVSVREVQRVTAERDALAQKVSENEAFLERARSDLVEAEARRDAFLNERPDLAVVNAADLAISAQVEVLERRLEEVAVRRDDLVLTAPFDGAVVQIPVCPGQVVRPGDPVLTLTSSRAEQIVVWLDETSVARLRQRSNLEARVTQSRGGRQVHARCPVVRIGSAVVNLPVELWPSMDRPVRGRPVVLGVPAGLDLVPGELVVVRWG